MEKVVEMDRKTLQKDHPDQIVSQDILISYLSLWDKTWSIIDLYKGWKSYRLISIALHFNTDPVHQTWFISKRFLTYPSVSTSSVQASAVISSSDYWHLIYVHASQNDRPVAMDPTSGVVQECTRVKKGGKAGWVSQGLFLASQFCRHFHIPCICCLDYSKTMLSRNHITQKKTTNMNTTSRLLLLRWAQAPAPDITKPPWISKDTEHISSRKG